jgi:hypothetical protein
MNAARRCHALLLAVGLLTAVCWAAVREPFPMGFSMSTFGAVISASGASGRQPWAPASFCGDSGAWGLASALVDYYGQMDNMPERQIRQSAIGVWIHHRAIVCKASFAYFNALSVYFEGHGFCSLGTDALPFVNVSLELEGWRAGLRQSGAERDELLSGGVSLWLPWSYAAVSLRCRNLILRSASTEGFAPPLSLTAGIHTRPHRFGSQGVSIEVTPATKTTIRFRAGLQYQLHRLCSLEAGLSARPLMMGFGFCLSLPCSSLQAALVHHPLLGWSRGVAMEYTKTH